ncbi:Uncharacterized conserved protein YecT, DUF1311 family [Gulbenkiania indica]|uniref:Uncharacterized conserved protein YecT, DUF1311 family n=2 Tax=Gulbenkiania TaxID=397456 RepID=A0A0K6H538_9NEIS|nr:lysozyme inhibitor LprI family protein [Gulbenkiania indica]TCW29877.1 uncharacterized protein YecT (DUF1311 family) [Gulbenkiania mobilis]CUA86079.1 Uncharacterized conserved protein YecT, DUF1311 family [Gulbenkiania indica]
MHARKMGGLAGLLALAAGTTMAASPVNDTLLEACLGGRGTTTQGMVECYGEANARQNARLNAAYRQLMAVLPAKRQHALRAVQRQWIGWRDASCGFYLDPDGGTLGRVEVAQCLYRTTHERADTLQELLDQRR